MSTSPNTTTAKNYDPGCFDLAERFVSDLSELSPGEKSALADRLASDIQRAIEDALGYEMNPCEFCQEPRAKGDHAKCHARAAVF